MNAATGNSHMAYDISQKRKGRSCLQTQRKATAQACKTSGRAPPPKRRAGKGAYDMAARLPLEKKKKKGSTRAC